MDIAESDIQLLIDYYHVEPYSQVDYTSFIRDVESSGFCNIPIFYLHTQETTLTNSSAVQASSSVVKQNPSSTPAALDADLVVTQIKAKCVSKHIRMHGLFEDFDPLRSGSVTREQVRP